MRKQMTVCRFFFLQIVSRNWPLPVNAAGKSAVVKKGFARLRRIFYFPATISTLSIPGPSA